MKFISKLNLDSRREKTKHAWLQDSTKIIFVIIWMESPSFLRTRPKISQRTEQNTEKDNVLYLFRALKPQLHRFVSPIFSFFFWLFFRFKSDFQ